MVIIFDFFGVIFEHFEGNKVKVGTEYLPIDIFSSLNLHRLAAIDPNDSNAVPRPYLVNVGIVSQYLNRSRALTLRNVLK